MKDLVIPALLLALAPLRACAQPTTTAGDKLKALSASHGSILDEGVFIISRNGKPVRVEEFAIEQMRDTLQVWATSRSTNYQDFKFP